MRALLLSGGLDSTALAVSEKPDLAININYGQLPAKAEREAAEKISKELGIRLLTIDIDCSSLGSGDLIGQKSLDIAEESDWWPYRNQLLITLAATKALTAGCSELLIGAVSQDQYHADGTQEFINKISDLTSYQEGGLTVTAPAIHLTAVELIQKSNVSEKLLAMTHSCHKANLPCFECRGCHKHQNTFEDLNLVSAS